MQTCRHELPDRTSIWNQRHLLHALREFEQFYNAHRPHQGIANARPLRPLPVPVADPEEIARLDIRRRERLGGILHEYHHAARPARTALSARAVLPAESGLPLLPAAMTFRASQDLVEAGSEHPLGHL
ncbi:MULTISPECIES: hypothetical protein [unclassified Streptomyces]|uniref:hypothetical protein n=1 Tax=unclassified Streptomyces TaxID=2593676 RepID=UPI0036E00C71